MNSLITMGDGGLLVSDGKRLIYGFPGQGLFEFSEFIVTSSSVSVNHPTRLARTFGGQEFSYAVGTPSIDLELKIKSLGAINVNRDYTETDISDMFFKNISINQLFDIINSRLQRK